MNCIKTQRKVIEFYVQKYWSGSKKQKNTGECWTRENRSYDECFQVVFVVLWQRGSWTHALFNRYFKNGHLPWKETGSNMQLWKILVEHYYFCGLKLERAESIMLPTAIVGSCFGSDCGEQDTHIWTVKRVLKVRSKLNCGEQVRQQSFHQWCHESITLWCEQDEEACNSGTLVWAAVLR